jgi:hypothetical protein
MDNQHKKIKGYRDLSQEEIDLMNEVKAKGEELRTLMKKIEAVLGPAPKLAEDASITDEADAPHYWLRTADAYFRSASMAAVRAIAQPSSY